MSTAQLLEVRCRQHSYGRGGVDSTVVGGEGTLYCCHPPPRSHWSYVAMSVCTYIYILSIVINIGKEIVRYTLISCNQNSSFHDNHLTAILTHT